MQDTHYVVMHRGYAKALIAFFLVLPIAVSRHRCSCQAYAFPFQPLSFVSHMLMAMGWFLLSFLLGPSCIFWLTSLLFEYCFPLPPTAGYAILKRGPSLDYCKLSRSLCGSIDAPHLECAYFDTLYTQNIMLDFMCCLQSKSTLPQYELMRRTCIEQQSFSLL